MVDRKGGQYFSEEETIRMQNELGLNTELRQPSEIVLIDIEVESHWGNGDALFSALNNGDSAVVHEPGIKNSRTNIYAPLGRDPRETFKEYYPSGVPRKNLRKMATATLLVDGLTRVIGARTGIADPETYALRDDIDPQRVETWIGAGVSPTDGFVDAHYAFNFGTDKYGNNLSNLEKVDVNWGKKNFPQSLSSWPASTLGIKGASGSIYTACASSLSNLVVATEHMRLGQSDFAFVGGVEYVFDANKEDGMKYFSVLEATSKRNEDPERASRPYDLYRDGLVPASGAVIMFVGTKEAADRYGIPYRAVIMNAVSTNDGGDEVLLNPINVARTAALTSYNRQTGEVEIPNRIVSHATSTPLGDRMDYRAIKLFTGNRRVPITSYKGNTGHPMGASGGFGLLVGVKLIETGTTPPILNYTEPDDDPEIEVDPNDFVTGKPLEEAVDTALIMNSGFGGHNANVFIAKPK